MMSRKYLAVDQEPGWCSMNGRHDNDHSTLMATLFSTVPGFVPWYTFAVSEV
jgi:hypothetical protein